MTSTAEGQTSCQSNPLPFETDRIGELEPSDCAVTIFPLQNPTAGEYWTLALNAGDLVVVSVRSGTLRDPYLFILDPFDVTVASSGVTSRSRALAFTAKTSGIYRALVVSGGYYSSVDAGTYTIHARRVTVPDEPRLGVTMQGAQVTLTWLAPLSPSPILEYLMEVGSVSGGRDYATFSLGMLTEVVTSAPRGLYFVRVRARNAFGWGTASNEQRIRVGLPLDPPQLLLPQIRGRSVTLAWEHPIFRAPYNPQEIAWELLIGSTPGGTDLWTYKIAPGNAVAVQFFDVPPGVYYVRIRGWNQHGPGEDSNEVVVRVF